MAIDVLPGPLGRRKTVDDALAVTEEEEYRLKKDVGALDVTVFGVGVIVGAGIFVLTGVAAATKAGPAIMLSFVVAAVVCALAALCYAELAAMVPAAGSAYTFSYVTLGEFIAFIIGWDLVLEFTVGASAVAVGWSAYLNATLDQIFGVTLPTAITTPFGEEGGLINLPGILLVFALMYVAIRGIKASARANEVLTAIIVAVLVLVIVVGALEVDPGNWTPFFPFGIDGVFAGAALVFFAFIGFDIVATTAEECRKPQRDMPIGIIGSLAITTVLYFAVAAVVTGMVVYTQLNTAAPVADAFENLGRQWAAPIVYLGALIALTNTVLILLLGQSRVAFAMARDGLLPRFVARTHPRWKTPYPITLIVGVVVAILAGTTPIGQLAELVSIGTLFAFILVALGVILLRRWEPDRPRPFRTPLVPWLPIASIILSLVLVTQLEWETMLRFVIWMVIGLAVYFLYSRQRSELARARGEERS